MKQSTLYNTYVNCILQHYSNTKSGIDLQGQSLVLKQSSSVYGTVTLE